MEEGAQNVHERLPLRAVQGGVVARCAARCRCGACGVHHRHCGPGHRRIRDRRRHTHDSDAAPLAVPSAHWTLGHPHTHITLPLAGDAIAHWHGIAGTSTRRTWRAYAARVAALVRCGRWGWACVCVGVGVWLCGAPWHGAWVVAASWCWCWVCVGVGVVVACAFGAAAGTWGACAGAESAFTTRPPRPCLQCPLSVTRAAQYPLPVTTCSRSRPHPRLRTSLESRCVACTRIGIGTGAWAWTWTWTHRACAYAGCDAWGRVLWCSSRSCRRWCGNRSARLIIHTRTWGESEPRAAWAFAAALSAGTGTRTTVASPGAWGTSCDIAAAVVARAVACTVVAWVARARDVPTASCVVAFAVGACAVAVDARARTRARLAHRTSAVAWPWPWP